MISMPLIGDSEGKKQDLTVQDNFQPAPSKRLNTASVVDFFICKLQSFLRRLWAVLRGPAGQQTSVTRLLDLAQSDKLQLAVVRLQ